MTAIQNVQSALAVTNIQPPPEGLMAALLVFNLGPDNASQSQSLQFASQGGLQLSQVVSLSIDNSENNYPVVVIHGILNEVVQVPAQATVIVPTLSNKAPYIISVGTPTGVAPTSNLVVEVVLLNYPRQSGTFSSTAQSTIAATGQNTTTIFAGLLPFNANGIIGIGGTGNFVFDSVDFAVESVNATAPGQVSFQYLLEVGGVSVCSGFFIGMSPSAGVWNPGAVVSAPIQRTWPQGIIFPRGAALTVNIAAIFNVTNGYIRCSISGLNTP